MFVILKGGRGRRERWAGMNVCYNERRGKEGTVGGN